ncbi:MAG TPA: GNAT family N-acetyltransferase [Acidimicrobiales bacterium]|nr:GNAT family N-acetyltransferase [Acidimicrobiales bacterium]
MARRDVSVHDGPLTTLESQDAALVAAHAFHTDPFFGYLAPKAVARARGLALWCNAICAHLGPNGLLLTARREGRIVGVGAWVPPGGYPFPASTQVAQTLGALRALYRLPSALPRGLRYLTAMEKAHPKDPLWYLQLLACAPEHQRSGVGAALMGGVLARCDTEGVASYLETQNEDNLPYYRRFGYEVSSTLTPVRGGPPLWAMRREPQRHGAT